MIAPLSESKELADLKYKINFPESCTLQKELKEVSGLSYDAENDCFYAINDEEGIIFGIYQGSCESYVVTDFDDDGDYEGIQMVGKHIYVLESKGNLIKYNIEKEKVTKEYRTALDSHNNSEGLCFDQKTNSLLIACKGDDSTHKGESHKNTHAIYRFDLDNKQLIEEPWMLIKADDLLEHYEKSTPYLKRQKTKIDEERFYRFAPSAVALNPIDDKVYVLSTRGKMLVVMTRDQKVDNIYYLDHSAYLQPEGLSFDLRGNMYISNEGKGNQANILKILNKKG